MAQQNATGTGNDPISIVSYSPHDALETSDFPASNAHLDATNVISIVCGNSRYHWALHGGYDDEYFPNLFWKTSTMGEFSEDDAENLQDYFPRKAFQAIGGPEFDSDHTIENLLHHITKRRIPFFHVYIISNGDKARETVPLLFSRVPCRIIQLQACDFVTGQYDGVGVDRCANLRAAQRYYGNPALVIDGGTAMTWTGTNSDGSFRGGGIAPGIGMKMRAMNESTGKLPYIDQDNVKAVFKKCFEEKKPLETYAKNTQDAMVVGVCREIALNLGSLVKEFQRYTKELFESNPPSARDLEDETPHNLRKNKPTRVVLTGGDGWLIEELLGEHHSYVIEEEQNSNGSTNTTHEDVIISQHKNLASHAIGILLKDTQLPKNAMTPVEQIRHDLLGLRVCKDIRRGTVCEVKRSEAKSIAADKFRIKYDDGLGETVGPEDLCEYLSDFAKNGEDPSFPDRDCAERKLHIENAKKAVETLENKVPQLKEKLLELQKKRASQGNQGPSSKKARAAAEPTVRREKKKKGPPEKSKKNNPFPDVSVELLEANPKKFLSERVAKHFDEDLYYGSVVSYDDNSKYWRVRYDDGDNEEYDVHDMDAYMKEYRLHPES
eukprot:CAMPEP_0168750070 /NCGR_PEP_ID=MMETSP0724-20121128/17062_1 /TAXON_ID=265536 /ORGANISM="Amphiprora sp., Strain CCMP467" /LENGTH=606 /DNA_ID=CAMNT_0008798039 /DNA_START=31 /DNA_END=1851 /DNA_ORIENTATION=-